MPQFDAVTITILWVAWRIWYIHKVTHEQNTCTLSCIHFQSFLRRGSALRACDSLASWPRSSIYFPSPSPTCTDSNVQPFGGADWRVGDTIGPSPPLPMNENIDRVTSADGHDCGRPGVEGSFARALSTRSGSAKHGELRHSDIGGAAGGCSVVLPAAKVPQTAPFTSRTHCPASLGKPAAAWQEGAVQNYGGGESGRSSRFSVSQTHFLRRPTGVACSKIAAVLKSLCRHSVYISATV